MAVCQIVNVAPLVGAWIESGISNAFTRYCYVAPLVGAWIERNNPIMKNTFDMVAPLVGAWIERIYISYLLYGETLSLLL